MIQSTSECPVTCHRCSYTTCIPCTKKKYILTQNSEAHCMNPKCKIKWTLKFLIDIFDKAWLTSTGKNSYSKKFL